MPWPENPDYAIKFLNEFHSHPIDYDVMYGVAGQVNGSKVKKTNYLQHRPDFAFFSLCLAVKEKKITAKDAKITAKNAKITAKNAKITAKDAKITAKDAKITAKGAKITAKDAKKRG